MWCFRCSLSGAVDSWLSGSPEWSRPQRVPRTNPVPLHFSAKWGSLHLKYSEFDTKNVRPVCLIHVCVMAEPVCAVGQGVAALCCATEESEVNKKWIFSGYSMTGVSHNVMSINKLWMYDGIAYAMWFFFFFFYSPLCLSWYVLLNLPTCRWLWRILSKTVVDLTQVRFLLNLLKGKFMSFQICLTYFHHKSHPLYCCFSRLLCEEQLTFKLVIRTEYWHKSHDSISIHKLAIWFDSYLDSILIHLDIYQVQFMSFFSQGKY